MAKEVFISYSSPDKEIAHEIYDAIEKSDIKAWIAPDSIPAGMGYAKAIVQGIKECSVMVLVYSNTCNASEHIPNEINIAVGNNKIIIPFCIDDSIMSDELSYYLARKQHIIAYPNYKVHIQKLLDALCSALGRSNMDATNNQAPPQVSNLSPSVPESNASSTKLGYNGIKRQSKKTYKSFMDSVVTLMDVWSNPNKEEDKSTIFSLYKEKSKAYDIPKSLLFEFDGIKFYMILSDDEKFYIGNIHAKRDDLNWLNNQWVNTMGNVDLFVSASVVPFSWSFFAKLFGGGFLSNDIKSYQGDGKKSDFVSSINVNKEFCDNLSKQTGYSFQLPRKTELKGVKDYAIPSCIVLRLNENTTLLENIMNK